MGMKSCSTRLGSRDFIVSRVFIIPARRVPLIYIDLSSSKGCGTGILGIAAHLVGFDEVYAIDTDPLALEIADNNVRTNKIPPKKIIISPPRDFERQFFDLIVANISLNPLVEFKSKFAKWIAPYGFVLISGILESQVCALVKNYKSDFEIVETRRINEWASVILAPK